MILLNTIDSSFAVPVYDFAPRSYMLLSVQTNPDNVLYDALYMALVWRHKHARSFTIHAFEHTDYYGWSQHEPTGYARFTVVYYSTDHEGMFRVPATFESNWRGEFDLLACLGIEAQ